VELRNLVPQVFALILPSLALATVLTPLAGRLARACKLVAPVRADRLHREPRPYGGGLAILAAMALAPVCAGSLLWGSLGMEAFSVVFPLRLCVGAALFFILGLLDDWLAFRAVPKLLMQFACAAIVVIVLGVKATAFLGAPGLPEALSILWIVAVVNAYNMFDHADGLAALAGACSLLFLVIGQWLVDPAAPETVAVALPCLVAVGALIGFFIYNYPPAMLFMGDAGSMLVGYLLAALTMEARYYFPERGTSRGVILVPLALLAVPLFDAACVTVGRIARGANPFRGDATSHLGHRLLARGWHPRTIVGFVALVSVVSGVASILLYRLSGWSLLEPAALVAGVCLLMLYVRRVPREAAR
jgi:UDP-GlcNAc:undecaprenyl-phosphate GlcNAc-1-phosphate transferase